MDIKNNLDNVQNIYKENPQKFCSEAKTIANTLNTIKF
jgi:hypothetical protein